MLKMPMDQLLQKLKEKSGLSDEELNQKLQKKMDQLSGLISKEGAAHIVANELGVQLFEKTSGQIKIKDLAQGMRDLEIIGKPIRIFEVRSFTTRDGREGKVGSFVLADDTGTIRVACWNSQADNLAKFKEKETVLKITDGYLKTNQDRLELHVNDKASIQLDPPGVTVDVSNQSAPAAGGGRQFPKATRHSVSQLQDGQESVELLGTIVQVFDPRFYEVCSQCGKRSRERDGQYWCPEHGSVTPNYAYLMSFFLDDGTDNIRVTCFRNTASRLCSVDDTKMQTFRESPMLFEDVKTDLLGQIVKVVGRVKKNDMFDRLEFTAQLVFNDPDPADELKK